MGNSMFPTPSKLPYYKVLGWKVTCRQGLLLSCPQKRSSQSSNLAISARSVILSFHSSSAPASPFAFVFWLHDFTALKRGGMCNPTVGAFCSNFLRLPLASVCRLHLLLECHQIAPKNRAIAPQNSCSIYTMEVLQSFPSIFYIFIWFYPNWASSDTSSDHISIGYF